MPRKIAEFVQTPNPNALKCVLDRPLPPPTRSYRKPADAAGDPLAEALFAVPGVVGLLIAGEWFTVNKSSEAAWPTVRKGIQRVLEQHEG